MDTSPTAAATADGAHEGNTTNLWWINGSEAMWAALNELFKTVRHGTVRWGKKSWMH